MAYGLYVKDTINITSRLPRYIGQISTGTSSGSYLVPDAGSGDVWVFDSSPGIYSYGLPVVYATENMVVWEFPDGIPASERSSATLVYGRY